MTTTAEYREMADVCDSKAQDFELSHSPWWAERERATAAALRSAAEVAERAQEMREALAEAVGALKECAYANSMTEADHGRLCRRAARATLDRIGEGKP
jgi:hypothetical protein